MPGEHHGLWRSSGGALRPLRCRGNRRGALVFRAGYAVEGVLILFIERISSRRNFFRLSAHWPLSIPKVAIQPGQKPLPPSPVLP